MVERLEERHMMTAATGDIASLVASAVSYDSSTPEGRAAMWDREIENAFQFSANLSNYTQQQIDGASSWVVRTNPGITPEQLSAATGLSVTGAYGNLANSYYVATAGVASSSDLISLLDASPAVDLFYPNVAWQTEGQSLPNDPYLQYQWHLISTEQLVTQPSDPNSETVRAAPGADINVTGAWDRGYTGRGVIVGVIDGGVQTNHPDLAANMRTDIDFDFLGNDNNPSPLDPTDFHGTAVASLIAGVGNNGIGTTGVAYNAQLVSQRFIPGDFDLDGVFQTDFAYASALGYRNNDTSPGANNGIDIKNLSIGLGGRAALRNSPLVISALRDGVVQGRGGLGVIYVKASGNSGGPDYFFPEYGSIPGAFDSAIYDDLGSTRYVITVGGVDHGGNYLNPEDGSVTSYPEAGPNVLVVAPTGNFPHVVGDITDAGSGIWTADRTGDNGANSSPTTGGFEFDRDFFPDTDYTSRFNGTSAATPIVSGVIALMLEANPTLTYRDIQHILLRSAKQNDQFDNSWIVNPYHHYVLPILTNEMGTLTGDEDPVFPITAVPNDITDIPGFGTGIEQIENRAAFYEARIAAGERYDQPLLFENGAGYTVSEGYGRYGEMYGYAHGTIDAELAVQLAEQWTNVAPEVSVSTFQNGSFRVQPRITTGDDAGRLIVPGAISVLDMNESYWEEFYADPPDDMGMGGPFSGDDPPEPDRGSPFIPITMNVSTEQLSVEWIEVKLTVSSGDIDNLRMSVVSPDGTQTQLAPFWSQPGDQSFVRQYGGLGYTGTEPHPGLLNNPPDAVGAGQTWSFATNRHWGEIFRPSGLDLETIDVSSGTSLYGNDGWKLSFENWSSEEVNFAAFEVIVHGTAIPGERIIGKVGIDDGARGATEGAGVRDNNEFNFLRYVEMDGEDDPIAMSPTQVRSVDTTQESFGKNITVIATRQEDGRQFRFVTGADGNYYFDVPDGTYTVTAVDPLGRTLVQNATPSNNQPVALSYTIVVAAGDDISEYKGNNFLFSPGDIPDQAVTVKGQVISDLNGDGIVNGDDEAQKDVTVFYDENLNGVYDGNDIAQQTFDDPSTPGVVDYIYKFDIPTQTARRVQVVVAPPAGWTFITPSTGTAEAYLQNGDVLTQDFLLKPPVGSGAGDGGTSTPGFILGAVYSDVDGNGSRGPTEVGIAGQRVWLDLNNDGLLTMGEPIDVTSASGAFGFSAIAPGAYNVRVEVVSPYIQTAPAANGSIAIALPSGATVTGLQFGLQNQATRDFGDLGQVAGIPVPYPTTLAQGGAWHTVVPGIFLGNTVDGEVNGQPTADATGDNVVGADEDGVTLLGDGVIVPGETQLVTVKVAGVGGSLNAWLDFNRDGDWEDAGEQIFDDVDLNPGTYNLSFAVPSNSSTAGGIGARFRWGSSGVSSTGGAIAGEVEDYLFATGVVGIPTSGFLPGDYDRNGFVNNVDHTVWRNSFGQVGANLPADGNGNGEVDAADYAIWRDNKGAFAVPASSSTASVAAASSVVSATGIDYSGLVGWTLAGANVVTADAAATTSIPADAGSLADEALLQLLEEDAVSEADDVEEEFYLDGDDSADDEALVLALEAPVLLAF